MYSCVCRCILVCSCACACRAQRTTSDIFLPQKPTWMPSMLRHGLSLGLELTDLISLAWQWVSCLCFSTTPGFFIGFRGSDSGCYVCIASPLLIELPLAPTLKFLHTVVNFWVIYLASLFIQHLLILGSLIYDMLNLFSSNLSYFVSFYFLTKSNSRMN